MSMFPRARRRMVLTAVAIALCAACGTPAVDPPGSAPPAQAAAGLTPSRVIVPAGLATDPFDAPRSALIPAGWTISLWARVPRARLAAWTPDGALLVSVPAAGQVLRLTPKGAGADSSVLLDGLEQPHGLTFAGSTLYVAQSDQVVAYDYTSGRATGARVVAAGLPDAKSPELGGA